ncbi:MAG: epoxyqueuosine reductase [Clostridia bacterium]|nr:epoxyqueuosine reductase [Clostridia bacterium]NCC43565.1 epoxyqueuosine reductase [Clostridia bacterium]
MKQEIESKTADFIKTYDEKAKTLVGKLWRTPIIGYADVDHPYIQQLPEIVRKTHQMPKEIMEDAAVVLCCFVPFTKAVAQSNRSTDNLASPEWAQGYEYTNAMLSKLNERIISILEAHGYQGIVAPESKVFDNKILKSNWSHRHFAYASGIGTFGLNNMLITEAGCSGRLTTIVTNLNVETGKPMEKELCLYKQNGTCGVCVKHCPAGALTFEGYDRTKCYGQCWENAKVHTQFGSSYLNSEGSTNAVGSEVCGKCVTYAPCTYREI